MLGCTSTALDIMKKLIPILIISAGAAMMIGSRNRSRSKRLEESGSDAAQVYVFEASWCELCKEVKPMLIEVSKRHPEIPFRFVDVDGEDALVRRFEISLVPTVIAVVNEKIVRRIEGKSDIEDYEALVTNVRAAKSQGSLNASYDQKSLSTGSGRVENDED